MTRAIFCVGIDMIDLLLNCLNVVLSVSNMILFDTLSHYMVHCITLCSDDRIVLYHQVLLGTY